LREVAVEQENIIRIKNAIRDVPDFPKKGIVFKDITTLLKNNTLFSLSIDLLHELVKEQKYDVIAAIESRGFIFGAALAIKMNLGFVPIRKPGKLPAEIYSAEYSLEYGTDMIEIHADAIEKGSRVLLIDDLLATGGTAAASCKLIEKSGAQTAAILFLVELEFLKGRDLLQNYNIYSLVSYK
jgi:adenine phosphoribosyltransferase